MESAKAWTLNLYYYLINAEFFPDVLPYARHFVTTWLNKAARGLNKGELPIPFDQYKPDALDGCNGQPFLFKPKPAKPPIYVGGSALELLMNRTCMRLRDA